MKVVYLSVTLVQTTYSTCCENGLTNENAFMANHTHFCALLRKRYWTVGIGVRRFMAGERERERERGREGERERERERGRERERDKKRRKDVHTEQ